MTEPTHRSCRSRTRISRSAQIRGSGGVEGRGTLPRCVATVAKAAREPRAVPRA
jgi:hypothetical protein